MIHTCTLTFFQPSWFLIQTKRLVIYIDPAYLKKYYTHFHTNKLYTTWPQPIDGLPDEKLPKADLIFITHHHKDHCKKVTVDRLRKKDTIVIAPPVCKKELGKIEAEVRPGDTRTIKGITFSVTQAYNTKDGNSTKKQHKKDDGVGYILTLGNTVLYHAGDTDLIPEMQDYPKIDVALVPIGGTFTMDIQEAVEAVKVIKPKIVIPMHNLGQDMSKFKEQIEKESPTKALVLNLGGTTKI